MKIKEHFHAVGFCAGDSFFHIVVVAVLLGSLRIVYFFCPLRIVPEPQPDERRTVVFKDAIWIPHLSLVAVDAAVVKYLIDVGEVCAEVELLRLIGGVWFRLCVLFRLAGEEADQGDGRQDHGWRYSWHALDAIYGKSVEVLMLAACRLCMHGSDLFTAEAQGR